jgi:hypothetical protein
LCADFEKTALCLPPDVIGSSKPNHALFSKLGRHHQPTGIARDRLCVGHSCVGCLTLCSRQIWSNYIEVWVYLDSAIVNRPNERGHRRRPKFCANEISNDDLVAHVSSQPLVAADSPQHNGRRSAGPAGRSQRARHSLGPT